MTLLTVWADDDPATTRPDYVAIRFFHDDWVGNFTGDHLAAEFPDFDTRTASR